MDGLTVLVDFRSPHAHLAIAPTLSLLDTLGATAHWQVLLTAPLKQPERPNDLGDRGAWHRWHRGRYQEMDLVRYARALGAPARRFEDGGLYRAPAGAIAAMAVDWVRERHFSAQGALVARIARGYWDGDLALDDVGAIAGVVASVGGDADAFANWCAVEGPGVLANSQAALAEQGYFNVPAFVVGEHVFYGRQHLPWVGALLSGDIDA